MSSNMMDTEAGGENTQYEAINTFTKPHRKTGGQMGEEETQPDATTSQMQTQSMEKGEKAAGNVRYGESISEHGFGGETQDNGGFANQGGFGSTAAQQDGGKVEQSRREQGYGGGSGVGA